MPLYLYRSRPDTHVCRAMVSIWSKQNLPNPPLLSATRSAAAPSMAPSSYRFNRGNTTDTG